MYQWQEMHDQNKGAQFFSSPDKVRAIDLEPSKDKKELYTFLGMAIYIISFGSNLADHTNLLKNLLKRMLTFQGIHHIQKPLRRLSH